MIRMARSVVSDADISGSDSSLERELHAIVGGKWVVTEPTDMAPYLVDWRNIFRGHATAVVRPRSTGLYARRARRLLPAVRRQDLLEGGAGVRAQAVDRPWTQGR